MPRDSKGRFTPNINQQVTDLGVVHKIDGKVIDLTDTAMQRQTRLAVERKYEDNRIVREAKAMMAMGFSPEEIWDVIGQRVARSELNDIVPAR